MDSFEKLNFSVVGGDSQAVLEDYQNNINSSNNFHNRSKSVL